VEEKKDLRMKPKGGVGVKVEVIPQGILPPNNPDRHLQDGQWVTIDKIRLDGRSKSSDPSEENAKESKQLTRS
jgi:hypothetical protein